MAVAKGQKLTRRAELRTYPCMDRCGAEVLAYSSHPRRCDDCRLVANREKSRRWKERNPSYREGKRSPRYEQHRMTADEYVLMLAKQNGRCLGCGRTPPVRGKQLHVDHDHDCCGPKRSCEKCRRGLLCIECNMLLGLAHDDPATLISLAEYLGVRRG